MTDKRPWTAGEWGITQGYNTLQDELGTPKKAVCVVWTRKASGVYSDERKIMPCDEGQANARLIAAAPQMYEALEGCVKTLHYVNTLRVVETNSLKEVLDAARTALRTANPSAFGEGARHDS